MAIDVLNILRKENLNAKLCIIGPSKEGELKKLKNYIETLDLGSYIEFTGILSKKVWHKKSEEFDIFINTTNVDNTPVSLIEAMALGLPIVSTNAGGLPYLIDNHVDGVLVNKNDAHKMAKEIINLIDSPKKSFLMTVNARNKSEKFDLEIVKKQWINLLN